MKKFFIAVFAVMVLFAFTAPVMAKLDIGGIVFVDLVYDKRTAEDVAPKLPGVAQLANDWKQLQLCVPNISRFKATWTNEDNVTMYIEVGFNGTYESVLSPQADNEALNLRAAYGQWKVNESFELMVGYDGTMFSQLSPNQLIGTCNTFQVVGLAGGNVYSGRVNQIRGTWRMPWNPKDRLAIAIVGPARWALPQVAAFANVRDAALAIPADPASGLAAATEETTIPRFDIGMPLHFGPLSIYPSAMWAEQNYDQALAGADDSVRTYALSLGLSYAMGPFTFDGEINYGENLNNQNFLVICGNALAVAHARQYSDRADGQLNRVSDTEFLGWWVDLGFKV
ncbi:MAG: hypothetical protein ABII26_09305, partial [Pseudomonadota bacterium]